MRESLTSPFVGWMRGCLLLAGVLQADLMLFATPHLNAGDPGFTVQRDLVFANPQGDPLKLDLYMPSNVEVPPLVVFIHGGGWQGGDRSKCRVGWLAEEGFAVASISYRLTDRAIFPAQIHDCKAAVRWLRAQAGVLGFRSDRIGVAGTSAGGMLSALLATSGDVPSLEGDVGGNLQQSSRVQAAVDYYGATDFALRSRTQPERADKPGSVVFKLLGGAAKEKTDLAKLASAVTHVSQDDPPLLILHGQKDKTVLLDQSQRLFDAYASRGLSVSAVFEQEAGHGGDAFFTGMNRELVIAFFKRHLSIPATESVR
ncbi:MAG: alpha/beta hydrolase [Planctomycetota bacterium]